MYNICMHLAMHDKLFLFKHLLEMVIANHLIEQDKSSDVEQQSPFGDRKYKQYTASKRKGIQNQREHHII